MLPTTHPVAGSFFVLSHQPSAFSHQPSDLSPQNGHLSHKACYMPAIILRYSSWSFFLSHQCPLTFSFLIHFWMNVSAANIRRYIEYTITHEQKLRNKCVFLPYNSNGEMLILFTTKYINAPSITFSFSTISYRGQGTFARKNPKIFGFSLTYLYLCTPNIIIR